MCFERDFKTVITDQVSSWRYEHACLGLSEARMVRGAVLVQGVGGHPGAGGPS